MYGRLSYTFADDPKIARLSPFAECFFFRAVALSGRNKWGGHIPNESINAVSPPPKRGKKSPESLLQECLNAALCVRDPSGFRILSFPQWNPYGMPSNERKDLSTPRVKAKRERDKAPHETRFTSDGVRGETHIEERKGKERKGEEAIQTPTESAPAVAGGTSQLPEAEPEKPRRKIDPAKLQPSQIVWNFYADLFYVSCGARPDPQDRHFVQINRLLKNHAPDGIASRLKNYFESPPWVCREGSRDFDRFVKFFDQLAVPATETAQETVDRVLVKSRERAAQIGTNSVHQPLLRAES